jgi:nicotinate-nucleotide adenylyltransferase
MCKRCFPQISSNIEVSDVELKREGKSYTADTIHHFKDLGNEEIYLLCGTDMMLTLDRWYNFEYIFTNAKIVYIRRENDAETTELLEIKTKEYEEKYGAKIHFIDVCAIELSSSEIREKINASGAHGLLTDDVINYIKDKDLYRKE